MMDPFGYRPCPKPKQKPKKTKDIPKDIRRYVLERDIHCCVRCGAPGHHLHHIIGRGRFNPQLYNFKQGVHDPRNLCVVCVACHQKIHADPDVMKAMLEWQKQRFGEVRRMEYER